MATVSTEKVQHPCIKVVPFNKTPADSNPKDGSVVQEQIKCVEFHLFFDGTWNSRYNSNWYNINSQEQRIEEDKKREQNEQKLKNNLTPEEREEYQHELYLYNRKYKTGETSFSRAPSGIDRMARAFRDNASVFAFYVDGSGTKTPKGIDESKHNFTETTQPVFNQRDFSGDSGIGAGFGIGGTGVYAKISQMLRKVANKLQQLESSKNQIPQITLNIYGFSRGAATARMFIHRLMNWYKDNEESRKLRSKDAYTFKNPNANEEEDPIASSLWKVFEGRYVYVKFVGLFDTVSSIGLNHQDDVSSRGQGIVFEDALPPVRIVHLVAAHEYRQKYGVTTIQSAVAKGYGFEVALPGCHTDIGDGLDTEAKAEFNKETQKDEWKSTHKDTGKTILSKSNIMSPIRIPRILLSTVFSPLLLTSVMQDELKARQEIQDANFGYIRDGLIKQGWFTEQEITFQDTTFGMDSLSVKKVYDEKRLPHKSMSGHYPKIPTKIMLDIMQKYGEDTHFKDFDQYDIENVPESEAPDLQKIYQDLRDKVLAEEAKVCQKQHEGLKCQVDGQFRQFEDDYIDIDDFFNEDTHCYQREILYHDYLHWCSEMQGIGSFLATYVNLPHIDPKTNHFYRLVING